MTFHVSRFTFHASPHEILKTCFFGFNLCNLCNLWTPLFSGLNSLFPSVPSVAKPINQFRYFSGLKVTFL